MPTDIPLIMRALRRHRIIVAMIALQIAIACAIMGNGFNLLFQRFALQRLPTGLAEARLFVLDVETLQGHFDAARRDEVIARVAALPDVSGAAYVNSLPFSGVAGSYRIENRDGAYVRRSDAALYYGGGDFLRVLGVNFVAGRNFDVLDSSAGGTDPLAAASTIILSESLSKRLAAPVGTLLQVQGRSMTVVGIVADVMPPMLSRPQDLGQVAFIPSRTSGVLSSKIIVNAAPRALGSVMADAVAIASGMTPGQFVWSARRFVDVRADYFAMDRVLARLVGVFMGVLGLVVAGGVGGLSSYWIQRRCPQIATRRALGARRADIAWYFLFENLVVAVLGAVLGVLLALMLNVVLGNWIALPRLPLVPLLLGAGLMIAVGQLTVLLPVRKALKVAPAALRPG